MSSTVKFTFLIVNNFNDNLFYYRIELPPLARIEISKISDAYDKRLFVNYSDDPWTDSFWITKIPLMIFLLYDGTKVIHIQ